jgi:hypothetical protein
MIKIKKTISLLNDKICSVPEKKEYSCPVLRVYGSVSKLTMGLTGSAGDGTSGRFRRGR